MQIQQKRGKVMKDYKLDEIRYLRVYGRNDGTLSPCTLFWTGSGIEMNVKAKELWIEVEADYSDYEPWISIAVDGAVVARQMLVKGRYWIPVLRMMDRDTMRNVRILREVQAMSGDADCMLRIHGVRIDGEFVPLEEKAGKIEFIGDSLTSGEGTIGAVGELNWNSMVFSAVNGYAVQTADALNLDFHVISQSGWGVLSSWDGDPSCSLPQYYEQVCGLLKGERNKQLGADQPYDFAGWLPEVVVIALGTNDASAFEQPAQYTDGTTGELFDQKKNADGTFEEASKQRLMDDMEAFLVKIRKNNPKAQMIWIYNMMVSDVNEVVTDVVEAYKEKTGDTRVSALKLPIVTQETTGSREHPGVEAHKQYAKVLVKELEQYYK